jgi:hypothetical protein
MQMFYEIDKKWHFHYVDEEAIGAVIVERTSICCSYIKKFTAISARVAYN